MASTYISDHTSRILKYLAEQFKNKPRIQSLLTVFATQIQEIEDVGLQLITLRALDAAAGTQLDNLGTIVGEERLGRTDDDYRLAIRAQILINTSSGTPNQVMAIVKALTSADTVLLQELYPATVQITAFGTSVTIPADLSELIQSVLPSTVSYALSVVTSDSFKFDGPSPGKGYADVGFTSSAGKYTEAF